MTNSYRKADWLPQRESGQGLTGHRALITGGGSGIGEACAYELASRGANIIVADVDEAAATQVASRIGGEPWVIDLSETTALEDMALDIDILVNCAGVQHLDPLHQFDPERFRFMQRLMVEAPFLLTRAVLPGMYAKRWGRIINVSSVHGLVASPFKVAYVTAKHALEGLSKVTALEGGEHGVTSNCINPGFVRTPLMEKQVLSQAELNGVSAGEVIGRVMLADSAIKRLVEPREVAALVAWVVSDQAAMTTGASYSIDGGWTAH